MKDLVLVFDKEAHDAIKLLQKYYRIKTPQKVVRKALALLSVAAENDALGGELIFRRDDEDTKIMIQPG